jgi:voltage-gated potassium channel
MLFLSAVWLGLLVIELTHGLSVGLSYISTAIWVIFIFEFVLKLALAPQRSRFLARNILTLGALAVPALRLMRIARLLRLARFGRSFTLVRVIAGVNRSMHTLRRTMRRRGLGYVSGLTVIVCVLGALGMQACEAYGPNAETFATLGDSLWWTAMILTTMGSQAWPATSEGKLLTLLLSIYAFAVFGYIAAALASFFVGRDREVSSGPTSSQWNELRQELSDLRKSLAVANSNWPR